MSRNPRWGGEVPTVRIKDKTSRGRIPDEFMQQRKHDVALSSGDPKSDVQKRSGKMEDLSVLDGGRIEERFGARDSRDAPESSIRNNIPRLDKSLPPTPTSSNTPSSTIRNPNFAIPSTSAHMPQSSSTWSDATLLSSDLEDEAEPPILNIKIRDYQPGHEKKRSIGRAVFDTAVSASLFGAAIGL